MKIKSKNMFLSFLSILVATGMLASTSLADTPHWDVNWNFRKQIAITNNVSPTLYDYSMMVTLDTAGLISQGKMQSDCGDIRIIENGVEINYGIKNPNSASTEIYFIANDLIVGINNDIYVYYGNPDADNGFVENWKDAFYIWYDDFDTDRGWSNCPGNERPGSVTVDTINGWLYAAYSAYLDYLVCPTDGSSFPMNDRAGFKAETRIMAENDNWCQIMVILANSAGVGGVPILDFRVGHNDYIVLWDSFVPKSLDDDVWYEATAVYNRLTGVWYGEFANDGVRAGIRTPQEDDDFSTIMFDICNGINMYLDYLYLRYFIEPEPSYSLGPEESAGEVPPSEPIEEILDFIDSVSGVTLHGTGNDPEKSINDLKKILEKARKHAASELFEDAWIKLYQAYLRTDGYGSPPDLVTGESASELEELIISMMTQLLPEWNFEFETNNALVFSVSEPIDDVRWGQVILEMEGNILATEAVKWLISGLSKTAGSYLSIISSIMDVINAISERTDPVSILPTAENIEFDGSFIAKIQTEDPYYTAIVCLSFKRRGWADDDVFLNPDYITSDLFLSSKGGSDDPIILVDKDTLNDLVSDKNYIVVPTEYFDARDLKWWPDEGRRHKETLKTWFEYESPFGFSLLQHTDDSHDLYLIPQ